VKPISRQGLGPSLFLTVAAFLLCIIPADPGKAGDPAAAEASRSPLRVVVMDPLCDRLACDCVKGYAQRRYGKLCAYLEKQLGREVLVAYGEDIIDILRDSAAKVDLIIGKQGVVLFDAARAKISARPIARLTDKSGSTDLTGLFVVRQDDPAKSIKQLKGYKILFGLDYEAEKSAAAIATLKANNVRVPRQIIRSPGCSTAGLAVVEKKADAAIISSYALALLEGCDTIDKGALRVIGATSGVPFVTVFATGNVNRETENAVVKALLAVKDDKQFLTEMESKAGFVKAASQPTFGAGWTDWRGPNRDGVSPYVPTSLPDKPKFLWRQPLTGVALSGIAATDKYVIVVDKDKASKTDIFRCLNTDTGKELWTIEYPASEKIEFTNSPRANPVVSDGLVYLLGALGDLHCVELATGRVVWKNNIVKDFHAELLAWGMCSTPLIVDDKLIVNPGAKDASIVALHRRTGEVIWKTPGEPAGYSSFILGVFGGVRQIVGYDSISVGGWDVTTGRRIWTLLPKVEGDFNVPTPLNVGGNLLLATENNGTRLYAFDDDGKIRSTPLARNDDLAPDTSTPVVAGGRIFGCFAGLFCLDLSNSLKMLYHADHEAFQDYASLIAGNDHILIITVEGELILIEADAASYTSKGRLSLFGQEKTEVWSHPALLQGRLYIRNSSAIYCLLLD